ncbi:hypothetical protein HY641_03180 [Candidatus Woesearchaeota archaeon]|nr:hypothetical protein [Candidatus Woesearchaeota archaeon]
MVLEKEVLRVENYNAFVGPACVSAKRTIPKPEQDVRYLISATVTVPTNYTILVKRGYAVEKCPADYASLGELKMESTSNGGPKSVCPYDPAHNVQNINSRGEEKFCVEEYICLDKNGHKIHHPQRNIPY